LYWARKLLDEFESDDFSEDSDRLTGAVTLAIEALASLDIIYQGLRDTLVYWSEEQECFIQIDVEQRKQDFLEAQRKIGYRFDVDGLREDFGGNVDLPSSAYAGVTPEQRAAAESWFQEHPARWGGASLSTMMAIELVEPQSRLWHVIRVLECHEWMQETRKSIASRSSMSTVSQSELLDYVHDVFEICVAMGKSAEALEKKPIEYEAAASQEGKRARAVASGRKSSAQRTKRLDALMTELEALGVYYPKIKEQTLVDEAFNNAVERDPKLWRQGRGQKEAYLSEHIRSVEPYKSRYYAIFG
jgi:hypothetical protein